MIVLDGKHALLGRLASYAAKQALIGKKVVVVNCNETLVSGDKKNTIAHYMNLRKMGSSNQRGPYVLKSPERIMKRTIKGMLPHTQERGRTAMKRVMCYNEQPEEFKDIKAVHSKRVKPARTITLKQLESQLG